MWSACCSLCRSCCFRHSLQCRRSCCFCRSLHCHSCCFRHSLQLNKQCVLFLKSRQMLHAQGISSRFSAYGFLSSADSAAVSCTIAQNKVYSRQKKQAMALLQCCITSNHHVRHHQPPERVCACRWTRFPLLCSLLADDRHWPAPSALQAA